MVLAAVVGPILTHTPLTPQRLQVPVRMLARQLTLVLRAAGPAVC